MPRDKAYQQKIREYLKVPKQREEWRRYLKTREDLKTPMRKAKEIVGVDEGKIRQWQDRGLFSFERSLRDGSTGGYESNKRDKTNEQMLYGIRDIARLLIIKTLLVDKVYPYREIKDFIQQNPQFIDELINDILPGGDHEYSWAVDERLTRAEEAFFWRVVVPRSLYLSLCLLLEKTPDSDIWLLLPLSTTNTQADEIKGQRVKQLPNLGEVLLGHCSNENPFFTCITKNPMHDLPKPYKVIHLEWSFKGNYSSIGAYLLFDEKRNSERNSESASRCAKRLLQWLQETQSHWKPYLQEGSDFTIYDAPEFKKATLGELTMSQIAKQIIRLGEINDAPQQSHWYFCCVLLPPNEELDRPLKRRSLVVQGQGGKSPHTVNQTKLSPNKNSISMKAYHSGQIVYRPDIVDEEPDIALHEREKEIKSAIAIPIEGRRSTTIGVLYITSRETDAFSKDDDRILLRIMGRIIAEQVIIYRDRDFLADKISSLISYPNIVDNYLEELQLKNDFAKRLEERLKQIEPKPNEESLPDKEQQAFHDLSFLSINFSILNSRASERDFKDLTRELGKQIKSWMEKKSKWTEMYYMSGEQYYLLLGKASLEETTQCAFDLQATLLRRLNLPERIQISDIRLYLGAISYTYNELQDLLAETSSRAAMRVRITYILNHVLNMSKDEENTITVWLPQEEKFIYHKGEPTDNRSSPSQDERFLQQVANAVYERLKSENWLPPADENRQ